ncbi:nucleotidyltransferase family protein [Anaerovibrio sp.]|uniref:nucleotidyltransferase family protein n=1 Tax=Anaerovibrio sp. TaxID=1872532 RepID=UPI00388D5A2D
MLSIDEIKNAAAAVCKKYDVERAYLFGSYSRNEADEQSDVDIRIDTKKDNPKLSSLLKVCAFQCELEEVLHKKVQIITKLPPPEDDLNSIFRENVLRDEVLIYANQ